MTTRLLTVAVVALVTLGAAREANAQLLTLTLSSGSFMYTQTTGDPDGTPNLTSPISGITVTYRIRQNTSNLPWYLAIRADGDLRTATTPVATIPTTNTTWNAPGSIAGSGDLTNVNQNLDSGNGNVNPAKDLVIGFSLKNQWEYSSGTYTQTIIFTLAVL